MQASESRNSRQLSFRQTGFSELGKCYDGLGGEAGRVLLQMRDSCWKFILTTWWSPWKRSARRIEERAVVKEISREELKAKMDRGDDFVLVEALSRQHFESSHLPGAINLPYEFIDEA